MVVTGGGGSLGAALADHFARTRSVLSLDLGAARPDASGNVTSRQVDLLDDAALGAALDECIPRSDRIALLVNAVGQIWNEPVVALRGGRFQAHAMSSWRRILDANLTAPFAAAAQVSLRMARSGGGAIVFFSSISGRGNPGQAAYSAAKAGIEGLTRTMAAELGPLNIRVNAVAPGFFDVPSTRAALTDQQITDLASRTPLRKLGTLDDLISTVEFLATNAFITGAVIDVNGGLRF